MRVLSKSTLRDFWRSQARYAEAIEPMSAWYAVCLNATWRNPADVRATFGSASFVKHNVVFNIAGNKYRIVANIDYKRQAMFVKFVGTHSQYNDTDVGAL